MRGWMLAVGFAVTLAACGNDNQADDGDDLNQALTAQNIVANDVTAIDAVTGDAANMAADVDFSDEIANDIGDTGGNRAESRARRPAPASRSAPARTPAESTPGPAATPATEPASNSTE